MTSEDISLNQPRVNLSSAMSASLLSLYTCGKITSSVSPLYSASYPSFPVTATLIQGCLHTISNRCINASHLSVSQREHLTWFFIVLSELCFVPLISMNMSTFERGHRARTYCRLWLTAQFGLLRGLLAVPRGATLDVWLWKKVCSISDV